jgi:hypothetical protein
VGDKLRQLICSPIAIKTDFIILVPWLVKNLRTGF